MKVRIVDLEFENFLTLAGTQIENATHSGIRDAVNEWRRDAFEVIPKVPFKTGFLKRSHVVSVEKGFELVGVLTATAPYAATVHSGIAESGVSMKFKHAEEGEGAFWISSKLHRFADKYFRIIQMKVSKR